MILTKEQWDQVLDRMHGEGVVGKDIRSDYPNGSSGKVCVAVTGSISDAILLLTHIAGVVRSEVAAVEEVRFLADRLRFSCSRDTWDSTYFLPTVTVEGGEPA